MIFEPSVKPRLFAVPCGADFPRALVEGLRGRSQGLPPEALARAELIVNTSRMARRVRNLFDTGPAMLLPRMMLLTDLAQRATLDGLPPGASASGATLKVTAVAGTEAIETTFRLD